MHAMRSGIYAMLLLVTGAQLLAQSSPNTPTEPSQTSPSESAPPSSLQLPPLPEGTRAVGRRGHDRRCWREAGIAPAMVNERWKIEDNAKVQINQVCSEASLTPEKKRNKINQINQQTEQEIAKIIPAKQLAAFNACQAKLDQENAKHPGRTPQKQLGPCGGVIPTEPEASGHSHEHQPSNPPNQ